MILRKFFSLIRIFLYFSTLWIAIKIFFVNSPNIGKKRTLRIGHNDFFFYLNLQMIEYLLPTQHCKRYMKIPNRFFVVVIYRLFFNKISRTLNNKRAYGNIFCCFSHMIPSSKWYLQKPHKKALFCGFERKTMKNTKSFAYF